mmetsp:Transcript_20298/g.58866  ORF Transcript_20298/g.58866 Transcript_20298/m.58866 type:complete len:342 (-) Transcript_20298:552-1577(-)
MAAVAAAEATQILLVQIAPGLGLAVGLLVAARAAADLVLREQRPHGLALEAGLQPVLHNYEPAQGRRLFAVAAPAVADAQVQAGHGQVLLEVLEQDPHVPARVLRIVKGAELMGRRHTHGSPQHAQVVSRVRGREHQQDPLATPAHELDDGCAVLDAAVGHVEHAGRPRPAEVELRGLLQPPDRRGEHQEAQTAQEGEEAQEDHREGDAERAQNHDPAALAVLLAGAPHALPAPGKERKGQNEEHHGAQAVECPSHLPLKPAGPPRDAPDPLVRGQVKQDVVAPAQVKHLQPEAHPDLVVHAQRDGIQAPGAGKGRALGQAPVLGRGHVAALDAARVQRTE